MRCVKWKKLQANEGRGFITPSNKHHRQQFPQVFFENQNQAIVTQQSQQNSWVKCLTVTTSSQLVHDLTSARTGTAQRVSPGAVMVLLTVRAAADCVWSADAAALTAAGHGWLARTGCSRYAGPRSVCHTVRISLSLPASHFALP